MTTDGSSELLGGLLFGLRTSPESAVHSTAPPQQGEAPSYPCRITGWHNETSSEVHRCMLCFTLCQAFVPGPEIDKGRPPGIPLAKQSLVPELGPLSCGPERESGRLPSSPSFRQTYEYSPPLCTSPLPDPPKCCRAPILLLSSRRPRPPHSRLPEGCLPVIASPGSGLGWPFFP